MMNKTWRSVLGTGVLVFLVSFTGCSAHTAGTFKEGLTARPLTKFQIGNVQNLTGQTFEADVPQMFKDALQLALNDANLLGPAGSGEAVLLNSNIVEYKPGSALKRWVMPGWGSTVFKVRVDLQESGTGKDLGHVEAERSIGFGGLLTVGAWKNIVTDTAQDVVKELRAKMERRS
jgi:hypothetical protein